MKISAYAAERPKASLTPFEYEAKMLGSWEVRIRVTHCGICHSDIHLIDDDWGISSYPLVAGHEIIGTIDQIDANVKHLKPGVRVGVGWQAASCMECEWCSKGEEHLCSGSRSVIKGHGGFGNWVAADSRFVFPIPESIDSEHAAPLLCGGITVYSPLRHHGIAPSMKVGIIGIGGLGHLALQYARALGAEVFAFSTQADKERETKAFGAHQFVLSTNSRQMTKLERSIDFLLSTASGNVDWEQFMGLLRPHGRLCVVGASPGKIQVPPFALIGDEKAILGSVIGNPAMIREMLEFSARHGIRPKTELVSIDHINSAVERVRASRARYRIVLKH